MTRMKGHARPASGRDISPGGARRVREDALCRLRASYDVAGVKGSPIFAFCTRMVGPASKPRNRDQSL